jgi:hypothetical protein
LKHPINREAAADWITRWSLSSGPPRRDPVAKFVEGLPVRIRNGELSIQMAKQ